MIIFKIECTNFQDAAQVEKALKAINARYETEVTTRHRPNRKKRVVVGPAEVKEILGFCATHSDWTNDQIAEKFPCGATTIGRIRSGTHPLSKKVG